MGRERVRSDKDKARFDQLKNQMRDTVNAELADLNNVLFGKNKRIKSEKILKLFNESAGGSLKEKMVVNDKTGTKILKDKSGRRREKIKIDRGRYLKIKDRNNNEVLKIDLARDEVIKDTGGFLEELKKEVDVVKEVPKVGNGAVEVMQGAGGKYDLSNLSENAKSFYFPDNFTEFVNGVDPNTGLVLISPTAPVGTHVLRWQAENEFGKSQMATLTIVVKEKVKNDEVVPDDDENNENEENEIDKSCEKFDTDLSALERMVENVEDPTLGTPDGYNLDQVEGQLVAAEKALATLEGNEKFAGFRKDNDKLNSLKDSIVVLRTKLDSLQKQKAEKIAKRNENIKNEIEKAIKIQTAEEKQQKAELDKVEQEMKDAQAEISKNQADFAAKSAASFDAIKGGTWNVESGTSFDSGNLNSLEGVNHEMQKHDYEVQKFKAEMSYMNQGIAGMGQKFTEFEAKKDEFSLGKNVGSGVVAGGALWAGAAALGSVASAPALATVAGLVGVAEMGRNVVGAGWKRMYKWWNKKPLPVDSWANGTFLGMFTGENEEARTQQTEKLKFEEKYKEYSAKLQTKEAKLKSDGNQIRSAASDPSELMSERADKVVEESNIAEKITNLYKEVGQEREIPANLIKESEKAVKDKIRENLEPLATSLQAAGTKSLTDDAEIIAGVNSANLLSSEHELANKEFRADDIFTATLGKAGKWLKKGSSIPVLNGLMRAGGSLVEFAGNTLSRPDKTINDLLGLFTIDLSADRPHTYWPFSFQTLGKSWGGMKDFVIAKELMKKAQNSGKAWDWIDWGSEVAGNALIALLLRGKGSVSRGYGGFKGDFGRVKSGATAALKNPKKVSGKILEGAKSKSSNVKKSIRERLGIKSKHERAMNNANKEIQSINKKTKELKETKSKIDELEKANNKLAEAKKDFDKSKLESLKSKYENDLAKMKQKIEELKETEGFKKTEITENTNLAEITNSINNLNKTNKLIQERIIAREKIVKLELEKLDLEMGGDKPIYRNRKKMIKRKQKKIDNLKEKIEKIDNEIGADRAVESANQQAKVKTATTNKKAKKTEKTHKEVENSAKKETVKTDKELKEKTFKAEEIISKETLSSKLSELKIKDIRLKNELSEITESGIRPGRNTRKKWALSRKKAEIIKNNESIIKIKERLGIDNKVSVLENEIAILEQKTGRWGRDNRAKKIKELKDKLEVEKNKVTKPAKNTTVESATESATESVNSKKHLIPKWKKENILFKEKLTEMKTSLESYEKTKLENIKKNKSVDKIQVEIDKITKEMERTEKKIIYRETKLSLYDN